MKILILMTCFALISSCSLENISKKAEPSAKEQVAGLKKMCNDAAPAIKKRQAANSLYNRLGKRKKITKLFNNLYDEHKKNDKIGHMFKNVERGPFVKNAVDFFAVGTGGKGTYTGRNMKDAHAHLNITSADFMTAGADLETVMKGLNYGDNEIQEVVCSLVAFIPVVLVDQV